MEIVERKDLDGARDVLIRCEDYLKELSLV